MLRLAAQADRGGIAEQILFSRLIKDFANERDLLALESPGCATHQLCLTGGLGRSSLLRSPRLDEITQRLRDLAYCQPDLTLVIESALRVEREHPSDSSNQ